MSLEETLSGSERPPRGTCANGSGLVTEPEEGPAPQRGNHVDTHKETGHMREGELPLGPGAVTWA